MDSRDVTTAIRELVRPALREVGFSRFAGRNAWRIGQTKIDVVNFQSFGNWLADRLGCTTFSFGVNVGCYFPNVPPSPLFPRTNANQLPKEYECHFRGELHRKLEQPEWDRRDIWYVDPDGIYLEPALRDAIRALLTEGMAWFARLDDRAEVLRILREGPMTKDLQGYGNPGSQVRRHLLHSFDDDATA